MSSIIIEIGADAKKYSAGLDVVKKETKELEAGLSKIGKISAVAFAATAASIGLVVKQAAQMEKTAAQFEVLTGSVESATEVLKELQEFSAGTPFQFSEIAEAGKKLLGFGIEAGEVTNRMREIGDVAAASGADLNDLTLIFGQVQAAGKLTGERFLQLQERAIPIGPALAKTMGVGEDALKGLIAAGEVTEETFNKAFASISAEGGKAFGGMEKVSKTLLGKISTLKDNFSLLAGAVGKEFLPAAKKMADIFINFLGFLRSNPEIAKRIAIYGTFAATVTGVITTVVGMSLAFLKLRQSFIALNGASKILKLGIKGLTAAAGIGLLLIAIDLVVTALGGWDKAFAKGQAVITAFTNNVKGMLGGLGKLLAGVFTFDLGKIKEGFAELKDAAKQGFEEAAEGVADVDKPSLVPDVEKEKEKQQMNAEALAEQAEEIAEADRQKKIEKSFETQEADLEMKRTFLNDENNLKKEVELEAEAGRLDREKLTRKTFLKDTQKHGKAFATLNKTLQSEEVKGAEAAAGSLIKLQSSKSKTLQGVAKVAAQTQNAIDTAKGALAAYASLSVIPVVGPALGIAAAAALVAFGAEQAVAIQSANAGGIIGSVGGGGAPNTDTVLSALTKGELVTPRDNFDEVVEGTARQRGFTKDGEEVAPGGGGGNNVVVTVDTFIGTSEFVQSTVIPAIRDAVEFDNADIGAA